MELTFRHALFAAGAFLFFIGIISLLTNALSTAPDPGILEAFSHGFDTIFLCLFSGVLMGVGISLVGSGLVLQLLGSSRHVFVTMLFAILFLALSTIAVFFRAASPLFALVCFFAFISASAAFLLTGVWYALSDAARRYMIEMK